MDVYLLFEEMDSCGESYECVLDVYETHKAALKATLTHKKNISHWKFRIECWDVNE